MSTAVDISAVARTVGIAVAFKDLRQGNVVFLPQRVALIGQGATASTYTTAKKQVFSSGEVGAEYGFGSPLHLAAKQLFPSNGDGVGSVPVTVYPLQDDGSGIAASGDITAGTGTQTSTQAYILKIASETVTFTITIGDDEDAAAAAIEAAINANINMPVIAVATLGVVAITSKWKGESANDIVMSISGTIAGITLTITQVSSGAINPAVDGSGVGLNLFGDIWETIVVNCFEYTDTTTLDAFSTFNEGRWLASVRKAFIVIGGSVETTVATLTAAGDLRKTDRTNSIIVVPNSVALPLEIAARAISRIAKQANNNPPVDYAGLSLSGIDAGEPSDQFTYTERDALVKAGIATTELVDGVSELSDTVTFYHPDGETPPAYRYVVDIEKVLTIVFNLDLIFNSDNWKGKVLIPDSQATVNKDARQPKTAKAAIFALIDNLGLQAIISDTDFAKENTTAAISGSNPKRLDIITTMKLSGNTNIISIDFNFGFFFGSVAA